jgi:hypothetical protein
MGHASHESDPPASHRAAGSGDDARATTHRPPWSWASVQRTAPARSRRHPCARGGALRITRTRHPGPGRLQRWCRTARTGASAPKIRSAAHGVPVLAAGRTRKRDQIAPFRRLNIGKERATGLCFAAVRTEAVDHGCPQLLTFKTVLRACSNQKRPIGLSLRLLIECSTGRRA